MSAAELLTELERLGVKVWPEAGKLRYKSPSAAMTPELTERMKAAKPQLLALLAGRAGAPADSDVPIVDRDGLERCWELDRIIRNVCAAGRFADDVRDTMLAARRHMSGETIESIMHEAGAWAEREAAKLIRRARTLSPHSGRANA
jgi:hypothetical protein